MSNTSFTKTDLNNFKHELLSEIRAEINSITSQPQKRWLRTKELAKYLSISTSQIHKLKEEGTFTCTKVRGTNYYDRLEIDRKIESQEVL